MCDWVGLGEGERCGCVQGGWVGVYTHIHTHKCILIESNAMTGMCVCVCTNVYVCREREREGGRERDGYMKMCVYVDL